MPINLTIPDPTWEFRVNVCEGNCTASDPVTISIDFGYQRELLKALWPKDGDDNYIDQNYTLVVTDYQEEEVLNTIGVINPDTLDIDVPEINADGIYKIILSLTGEEISDVSQTAYTVVLCSLKCCYSKLASKIASLTSCDRRELLAIIKPLLYISQIEQLVVCDNNIVKAYQMIQQGQRLCSSVNCVC